MVTAELISELKKLKKNKLLNILKEESIIQILQLAGHHICQKSDTFEQDLKDLDENSRLAYQIFLKLLIESVRIDINFDDLSSLFDDVGLPTSFHDAFFKVFKLQKNLISDKLQTVGNALPHIVDVNWRMDYCIKSNVQHLAGIPNYNISLSTIKHGKLENVRFTCTKSQLQEFVGKLKDAARHTEKLTNF